MHVHPFARVSSLAIIAVLSVGVAVATASGASLNLKLKPKHPTTTKHSSGGVTCVSGGCSRFKIIATGTTDQPNTELRMFYNPPSHPCEPSEGTEEGGSVVGGQFSQITQANTTFPKAGPFSKTVKQNLSSKPHKSLICGYLVDSNGTTEKVTQITLTPAKKHHKQ
jgi:hypothetical protein